jgi:hypothetical protein
MGSRAAEDAEPAQDDQRDEREVIWRAQFGPQTALLTSPVFEVFFGGARGGGKTDGMLGEWANHAQQHGKHAIGLMVRRNRVQLIETVARSKEIYIPLGAIFHEQDKMWTFPDGARIRFAYLERDQDAEEYQGHSYTRVYIEEIGNFPSDAPIKKLMATLRSGAGVPCGFRATGNPGGPGHQWVKARYITPAPMGGEVIREEFENPFTHEVIKRDRVFIPSKLTDNKYLGNEYVANLQMAGSDELVRAWLEGDWDVIAGAFFDCWGEWRDRGGIIKPFRIPDHWLRFCSHDWGSARPHCTHWWAVASESVRVRGQLIKRGAMVMYREWYGMSEPNVGLKQTAEQVARIITEKTLKTENIAYFVADPAIFSKDGGPSIAERMMKIFPSGLKNMRRADNKRVSRRGSMGGWDQMRDRFIGEDEQPMMYFTDNCVDAIRTIPALQHDGNNIEDLDTTAEDHAADCARYGCMSRPYIRPKPTAPRDVIDRPTFDERFDRHVKHKQRMKEALI